MVLEGAGGGGGGGIGVDNGGGGGGGGAGGSYSIYSASYSVATSAIGYIQILYTLGSTDPVLQYNVAAQLVYYSTKTFVIEHPLYINKYLVHACLEGPEAGVYYRGSGKILSDYKVAEIYLADYVDYLACEFTIYVTPIVDDNNGLSSIPILGTSRIKKGKFTVYSNSSPCEFNYLVFGKRMSIEVEPLKTLTHVKGDGPYKWI